MRLEKQVKEIEQDIEALRASFQQNASTMNVYTTSLQFTTSRNTTNWSNSGSYNPLQWEPLTSMLTTSGGDKFSTETIQVTFSCNEGINTFATLEIDFVNVSSGFAVVSSRRIPYSGGSRWLVTLRPRSTSDGGGNYTWQASVLKFAVSSAAQGTLTAKMIWQ